MGIGYQKFHNATRVFRGISFVETSILGCRYGGNGNSRSLFRAWTNGRLVPYTIEYRKGKVPDD